MVASANEQQAQSRVEADLDALLTYCKAMQERQVREARIVAVPVTMLAWRL